MTAPVDDKTKKKGDTVEHRMTALYVLAQGKMPSWRRSASDTSSNRNQESLSATEATRVTTSFLSRHVLFYLCILNVACKVLLFPSYKSTDFFVHRHWKALTLRSNQLSILQWYSDDDIFPSSKSSSNPSFTNFIRKDRKLPIQTVHTLDYPPGFSWMEYVLSNYLGSLWFSKLPHNGCLDLMDDAVAYSSMSQECVAFMRTTVLLASDTIYGLGAYCVASTLPRNSAILVFLVLFFHPALLWLDHVHFQYNGTMLGVLMISLSCLLHANIGAASSRRKDHYYYWIATMTFGFLLTMKHLYLTNSLWFVVYVFRRYCCLTVPPPVASEQENRAKTQIIWLRVVTLFTLGTISVIIPFLPFFWELYYDDSDPSTTFSQRLLAWFHQLGRRLFPFGRGLVHSYWAGNVWALYVAFYRVWTRVMASIGGLTILPPPSLISPSLTAVGIGLAQLPGLHRAWWAATTQSNAELLHSLVLTSLGTFLFQYHAHEKAILTALIPTVIWYATVQGPLAGALLWDFSALSLLSLFPLLYPPQELMLKVCSTLLFLSLLSMWCHATETKATRHARRCSALVGVLTACTMVQLEIPYHWFWGRYEYMPLAVTSVVCGMGFLWIYFRLVFVSFDEKC